MRVINDCTSFKEFYGSKIKIQLISEDGKVIRTRYMTVEELYQDLYPPH